jgi:sulfoquinovosidase
MAVTARFEAKDDGEAIDAGFDLILGDRVILRQRFDAPAFRIAKGNPTVTMVRGNFRLEDEQEDERRLAYTILRDGWIDVCDPEDYGGAFVTTKIFQHNGHEVLNIAASEPFDRIEVDFACDASEIFWGGGEQMSHLVLNGRNFPMWTSEPGVGRQPGSALTDRMNADGSFAGGDYWTTNYPQPTILSSAGHCLHLRSNAYSEIDLSIEGRLTFRVWANHFGFALLKTDKPLLRLLAQKGQLSHPELVPVSMEEETTLGIWSSAQKFFMDGAKRSGQPPLPEWAIGGAIVGLKDGANSFARLEKIIAAGAAVSGLWCEDWVGVRQTSFGRRLFWDWQWNAERYPDLPAKIAELKARGIRFLGYVNPYLAVDGPQYAEVARLGYLARKLDDDEPYAVDFGEFDAGVVDFTNPAAAAWFSKEIIGKQMLDFGLDGWMADFGEYLPVDLRLHNGDAMEEHNRWPVHWAKVNADAVASRGRTGDALFFMRAGFTGVQQYCPLLWAGDQSVDFSRHDGIGTVITAALSAGLVGNAYSHSDVGGYTSLHGNVRTEELMQRWYELGAFTPVMRTHEGNRPDDNLQIDSTPELLSGFVRWSRVHAALAPWVRHLCDEATATGLPAQRALFLHYPDDRETFTIQDQYLYGADLMVAPVIEEGAVAREVYLPEGEWVHVWSGERFFGGRHNIDAPIGSPPVFWRNGSDFADLFASLVTVRDSI